MSCRVLVQKLNLNLNNSSASFHLVTSTSARKSNIQSFHRYRFFLFSGLNACEKKSYVFLRKELPVRLANIMKEIALLPDSLSRTPSVGLVSQWYARSFEEVLQYEKLEPSPITVEKWVKSPPPSFLSVQNRNWPWILFTDFARIWLKFAIDIRMWCKQWLKVSLSWRSPVAVLSNHQWSYPFNTFWTDFICPGSAYECWSINTVSWESRCESNGPTNLHPSLLPPQQFSSVKYPDKTVTSVALIHCVILVRWFVMPTKMLVIYVINTTWPVQNWSWHSTTVKIRIHHVG